ncbi:Di-sulfide bridge nucleocytoplasmic transport domain-containing protein [Phellopilus nigrolimitatus]|nr:Di-sulfide bridge nucleocytoplasmic transport domain-containing protein [Phellopilus nigrolimitatus]
MSTTYGRARSTEAPMSGIEFTNRARTIPAWRVDAQNQNAPPLKTSQSRPQSPFDPKKNHEAEPRPVFGENVRYLFRPPHLAQPTWTTPLPDTPEIDMKDVEITPPPHIPQPNFGRAKNSRGGEKDREEEEDNGGNEDESPERRLISNAAVRRLARRRGQAGGQARNRSSRLRTQMGAADADDGEESDEDDEYDGDGSPKKSNAVAQRTDTPYILLGYLQFLFNLSLILVFLYLLVQFIFTVQRDVEQRIGEYSMDILQEITTCAQLYKQNLCDTSPIPAMLRQCATWETCMSRDPKVVGRAKVGAEMLAEVVNGFVEPISWKTLLFTLSSLAFMTVFVNALLSLYRSRHHPDRREQPSHAPVPPIPFPPFHTPYGFIPAGDATGKWPPHPQMPWHPESEVDTLPRQRRRLENGETAVKP